MKNRLLVGAVAGALGGVAIKAVVRFVNRDSFGLSAETDAKTAHEIWRGMGWKPVSEQRAEQIGAAMHYGFAVAAGIGYAASVRKFPAVRAGRGSVFGAALWLLGDEVAVTASGLENPFLYSLFSHASALGAHVLYGVIVDCATSEKAC